MTTKILLPVDGSGYSNAATAFVAARPFKEESAPRIDLLNVQLPLPPRAGRAVGAEFARAWHEAESSKILKPAIAALRRTHLDPAWYCAVGNPGVEIADWADRHAIDLIVMGSHGRSALKGLVFGSVTQRVLASTAVPVLVLRTPKAPIRASLRVAIALDGSAYGEEAAQYVVRHHGLFGPRPKFALIHVHAPSLLGSSPRALPTASDLARVEAEAFEQALAPARELFAKEGLSATEHRIVGHPGEEIARFARAEKLDILVMGSHGRGALTAALLGSVACQVAAKCTTPLLLIREPANA
jgi:nucleotide-binding universal stress UspA family protein